MNCRTLVFDQPWPWLPLSYKVDLSSGKVGREGEIFLPVSAKTSEVRLWNRNRKGAWRKTDPAGSPLRSDLDGISSTDARFAVITPRLAARLSALPIITARHGPKYLELVLRAEMNVETDTDKIAFVQQNLLCRYTTENDMALANLVLASSPPRIALEVSGGRLGLDRNYLCGMNQDEEVELALVSELNYYAREPEAQELFGFGQD